MSGNGDGGYIAGLWRWDLEVPLTQEYLLNGDIDKGRE